VIGRDLPDARRAVRRWLVLLAVLGAAAAAAQQAAPGGAELYRIGGGDVLRLNVPQQSSLDSELTVSANGNIYLPQIGEVTLGGLSLTEAKELLGRRLQLYNPAITEVVLSVVEYSGLRIFVLGAVNSPGTYTFEMPPSLWEVLRAAGGPGTQASLQACRIISIRDGRPVSRTVNLAGYLTGDAFPTDLLQGGDTLVVPTVADGVVGVPPARGVQVFGGVNTPTTVPIEQPTELLTVLMLAGAPLESAEMHRINWVHRGDPGEGPDLAIKVNMRDFLERGQPAGNPVVFPGDVVYLPTYREGWFRRNWPIFLSSLTSLTTFWLAYDRLSE
jgi:polysaccharide biosynthesis/export protein